MDRPLVQVYRGIANRKLPSCMAEADEHNVRGGVEYAFMSTTPKRVRHLAFLETKQSFRSLAAFTCAGGIHTWPIRTRGKCRMWLSSTLKGA